MFVCMCVFHESFHVSDIINLHQAQGNLSESDRVPYSFYCISQGGKVIITLQKLYKVLIVHGMQHLVGS